MEEKLLHLEKGWQPDNSRIKILALQTLFSPPSMIPPFVQFYKKFYFPFPANGIRLFLKAFTSKKNLVPKYKVLCVLVFEAQNFKLFFFFM